MKIHSWLFTLALFIGGCGQDPGLKLTGQKVTYLLSAVNDVSPVLAGHRNDTEGSVMVDNNESAMALDSFGRIKTLALADDVSYFTLDVSTAVMKSGTKLIDGYVTWQSVVDRSTMPKIGFIRGETVQFYLSGVLGFGSDLYITDILGRVVARLNAPPLSKQDPVSKSPWREGFTYRRTASFMIADDMLPGIYFINNQTAVYFVVKSQYLPSQKIAIILPTNTAQAYSCAGGRSFYTNCPDASGGAAAATDTVTYWRPHGGHGAELFVPFLQWYALELAGDHPADILTDMDLEELESLRQYQTIVVVGHNEYTTLATRTKLRDAVIGGTNLAVLGANAFWWRARLDLKTGNLTTYIGIPPPDNVTAPNDAFKNIPGLEPERLTGASFDWGGFGEEPQGFGGQKGAKFYLKPHPIWPDVTKCEELDLRPNIEMDGIPLGLSSESTLMPDVAKTGGKELQWLGYAPGYRFGHTLGTIHLFKPTETSGWVFQVGSLGAGGSGFYSNTGLRYRELLGTIFGRLIANDVPTLPTPTPVSIFGVPAKDKKIFESLDCLTQ